MDKVGRLSPPHLQASVKWKERKEVLDELLPLAQSPKISPGDYGELVKALKKVITKDSNVMIVAVAGNIVAGLATGLRKGFQSYAPSVSGLCGRVWVSTYCTCCASGDCLTSRPKGRSRPRELWFSIYSCTCIHVYIQCTCTCIYTCTCILRVLLYA